VEGSGGGQRWRAAVEGSGGGQRWRAAVEGGMIESCGRRWNLLHVRTTQYWVLVGGTVGILNSVTSTTSNGTTGTESLMTLKMIHTN
jgi:hypothetical protein